MSSLTQVQTWKLQPEVVRYMEQCTEARMAVEPPGGRANFYPKGAMMYNGGQGAGDGGRIILYDTEEEKAQAAAAAAAAEKAKVMAQEAQKEDA